MSDAFFRWAGAVLLTGMVLTSGFYRARAERIGGRLPAEPEGLPAIPLRVASGLLVLAALILPIISPRAADVVSVRLPEGVRLAGLALTTLAWPFLWWVLASIGTSISQSVSTRANATLVTHGPYRWVRHPLYTGGFLAFLGLGLALESGPLLAGLILLIWWLPRRASREEANLVASYGDAYRAYQQRTGRFIPRLARREPGAESTTSPGP